jgi:F-box/leucine-rich repeat protein 2/20
MGCRYLAVLSVGGTTNVTDAAISAIAASCRQLVRLDVSATTKITATSVDEIAGNCARLESLDISGRDGVHHRAFATHEYVTGVMARCPLCAVKMY